jgi:hypothetical protein
MSGGDNQSPLVGDAIPLGDHESSAPTNLAPPPAGELLTLTFEDLIPDSQGEVVILSDAGHDIAVVTHQPVASQGVEASHIMASGLDVSGFAFCTFADGVTLFYPTTQRLFVTDEG